MESNLTIDDYLQRGDEFISKKEGYAAMLNLLSYYFEHTGSNDLTDILSGGGLMEDGFPLDKSFWYYWLDATDKVKGFK